jgi:hypothetical protein
MMEGMIIAPLQQMLIVLIFGWSLHIFAPERFLSLEGERLRCFQGKYLVTLAVFLSVMLWAVKSDLTLQKTLLVSPDGIVNLSYGPRFWADGHDRCSDWHRRYENR